MQESGVEFAGRRAAIAFVVISVLAVVIAYLAPRYLWRPLRGRLRVETIELLSRCVHVIIFTCWTPAWVGMSRAITLRTWTGWSFVVPVIVAVLSEMAQVWIPGHTPDFRGGAASIIGVVIGFLVAWCVYGLRRKPSR